MQRTTEAEKARVTYDVELGAPESVFGYDATTASDVYAIGVLTLALYRGSFPLPSVRCQHSNQVQCY